jgi:hypothetical protein
MLVLLAPHPEPAIMWKLFGDLHAVHALHLSIIVIQITVLRLLSIVNAGILIVFLMQYLLEALPLPILLVVDRLAIDPSSTSIYSMHNFCS